MVKLICKKPVKASYVCGHLGVGTLRDPRLTPCGNQRCVIILMVKKGKDGKAEK